jgi:hypothetical protein
MNLGDFIVVKVSCLVLEKHAKSSIWIYNGQEWKFWSHLSLGCESKLMVERHFSDLKLEEKNIV